MGRLAEAWRRLRTFRRGDEFEQRLDEEVRFHLDREIEERVRAGEPPEEARRAAVIRFGGIERVKELARDEARPALLQDFSRDLRTSARSLRRSPAFTAAAVLTVGLGTGAATAVFSVVEHVLLRPLPYPDSDRIVRLYQLDENGARSNVSQLNFEDWRAGTTSFQSMAVLANWGATAIVAAGEPHTAVVTPVTRGFFDVMGVAPTLGRTFGLDEQQVGGVPAAVVSHAYWLRWLGGRGFPGAALRIGGRSHAVVGVMPEGFDHPAGTGVWLARELNPPDAARTAHNHQALARLTDGVSLDAARADLSAVSRAVKGRHGEDTWMSDAEAVPLLEQVTATSKPLLRMLFAGAALLLVIACINVSSLLVARASARRAELAVRLAMGASRFRLARQLLAESLLLSVSGGAVGLALAAWTVPALVALGPAIAPRLQEARVDWVAMAFALAASAAAAAVLALATACGARDVRLATVLADSQRTGTGRGDLLARQTLVAAQVALTLVLLAGAGLLARSFARLLAVDTGFRLDEAVVADLVVTTSGIDYRERRVALLDTLLDRLRALPGVTEVGLTTGFPLGGGNYSNGRYLEMTAIDEIRDPDDAARLGRAATARAGHAGFRIVSGGYFETLGIPILHGRTFDAGDRLDTTHVAVVSRSLAARRWPERDPIGRFIQFGSMDGDTRGFLVVGVVGDVRELALEAAPGPILYASYAQRPVSLWRVSVIVRGPDPEAAPPMMLRVIRDVDPEMPVQFRTVSDAFDATFAGRRFSLLIVGVFSAAALLLATLGLYGVVSYVVAERRRELAVRMALGARPRDLVTSIVVNGARLAAIGIIVGLAASVVLADVIRSQLFGVQATDPFVLGGVALVVLAAAAVASYLPARRATRASPVQSLRAT